MVSQNNINANSMKEWETARAVLAGFDTHLHDLRRYGFSLITALLAANAVIFQTKIFDIELTDYVKLAVLGVTLLLIFTLSMIDHNYRVFLRAAATRARILERNLNLDLTEVIEQRYKIGRLDIFFTFIYVAFTCGILILGVVSFSDFSYFYILLIAWIFAISAIGILSLKVLTLSSPYGEMDWTLDRLDYNSGDEIRITLTNLDETTLDYPEDTIMWKLFKQGEKKPEKVQKLDKRLELKEDENYTWLWKNNEGLEKGKKNLEDGIYKLWRITKKKKTNEETGEFEYIYEPLKKILRIRGPSDSQLSGHEVISNREKPTK